MLAHEEAGLPPLLHFDYEMLLDARTFERPANYALLHITRCGSNHLEQRIRPGKTPVMVIDPRAGHGPGIGGFKRDSEVGMALAEGHPVYFVASSQFRARNRPLEMYFMLCAFLSRRSPGGMTVRRLCFTGTVRQAGR